jgi:hypothetical protein
VHVQEAAVSIPTTSKTPGSQNPAGLSEEVLQLTKKLTAAMAECELLRAQLQDRNMQAFPGAAPSREPDQATSTGKRIQGSEREGGRSTSLEPDQETSTWVTIPDLNPAPAATVSHKLDVATLGRAPAVAASHELDQATSLVPNLDTSTTKTTSSTGALPGTKCLREPDQATPTNIGSTQALPSRGSSQEPGQATSTTIRGTQALLHEATSHEPDQETSTGPTTREMELTGGTATSREPDQDTSRGVRIWDLDRESSGSHAFDAQNDST